MGNKQKITTQHIAKLKDNYSEKNNRKKKKNVTLIMFRCRAFTYNNLIIIVK